MTEKIYSPDTIEQAPFPNEGANASSDSSGLNVDTFNQASFPAHQVASEVVSTTLNTQQARILGSYRFSTLGAIQIGSYVSGVSGDIKISPAGIVGRSTAGATTFALDGETGSLTLTGTITATAGLIGGFTLAVGYMYAGSGANTAGMSPADYPFWAGATYANRATAPFTVTPAGAVTATSGTIAGWVLSTTTLSKNNVIIDSAGKITIANGDNKIEALVESGNGFLDFYYGGTRRGRFRGTTAGTGIRLVAGDFVVENDKSISFENTTGNDWSRLGVNTSNEVVLVLTANDQFYIKNSAEDTNLFTVSATTVYADQEMYIEGDTDDAHRVATRGWVDTNYVHK